MLYSHSIENEKFSLYLLFLNHVIEGDKNYKEPVDHVILETCALAKGTKNLYSIDRDSFPIVVYLQTHAAKFFKTLNPDPLAFSSETYKRVSEILSEQHPLPNA